VGTDFDYAARERDAAWRQMPTIIREFPDVASEYLTQTGGFVMALRRDIPSSGGAHVMLTEEGDDDGERVFYVFGYSSDDCEGHEVVSSGSGRNAVWWFGAWAPRGACPCEGGA
jgi:hypothetical protein